MLLPGTREAKRDALWTDAGGVQMASAVHYLHGIGIAHRDLKASALAIRAHTGLTHSPPSPSFLADSE